LAASDHQERLVRRGLEKKLRAIATTTVTARTIQIINMRDSPTTSVVTRIASAIAAMMTVIIRRLSGPGG